MEDGYFQTENKVFDPFVFLVHGSDIYLSFLE